MINLDKHELVVDRYEYEDDKDFIEQVFELAFGGDAINRDYTRQEVLEKLKEFSDRELDAE